MLRRVRGIRGRLPAPGPWRRLTPLTRRRVLAGAIVAALAGLAWVVLLLAAPCGWPGGGDCPPADDAIALVPGDALAYVHAEIDPERDQYVDAALLGRRVPRLGALLAGALGGALGVDPDLLAAPPPWAGDELAVALLPGPRGGDRLTLLAVDDPAGAGGYAERLIRARGEAGEVAGVELHPGRRGQAYALRDGFLLLGDEGAVRETLASTPGSSLRAELEPADGPPAGPLAELPEERLAYAYLSGAGSRALLQGTAGPLGSLLGAGASTGLAAALTVQGGIAGLTVRSGIEPGAARRSAGPISALPGFSPQLPAELGAGTLAYLGLSDPAAGIGGLIDRAEAGDPELGPALERLQRRLRAATGIDLRADLLPLLGGEAALSAAPAGGGADAAAPDAQAGAIAFGAPYASLIADGVDAAAARRKLGSLERPLERALGGGDRFETLQIAGAEARGLRVSPAVDLTYAAYDERLVIATDPHGIDVARGGGPALAEAPGYEAATAGLPPRPGLLAYLNLDGLRGLLEQAGLAEDPAYAVVAGDLRALHGAALAIGGDEERVGIDLRLVTGEP